MLILFLFFIFFDIIVLSARAVD